MVFPSRLVTWVMWAQAELRSLNPLRYALRKADIPILNFLLLQRRVLIIITNAELWKYDELKLALESKGYRVDVFFSPHGDDALGVLRAHEGLAKSDLKTVNFRRGLRLWSIWRYERVIFSLPYLLPRFPFRINFVPASRLFYTPYSLDLSVDSPEKSFGKRAIRIASVAACSTLQVTQISNQSCRPKLARIGLCGYPGMKLEGILETPPRSDGSVIWAPHYSSISSSQEAISSLDSWIFGLEELESRGFHIVFRPHPLLERLFEKHKNLLSRQAAEFIEFCFNERVHTGDYQSLFRESLTLIHNSKSFIGEHLSSGRKQIYWMQESTNVRRINTLGIEILSTAYKACTPEELIKIVEKLSVLDIKGKSAWTTQEKTKLDSLGLGANFEEQLCNFMDLRCQSP